jgi:UDP-N-acetylmuramoyl-L-alanyl-D-glutamate--2,6-diaminopimelate ligase
MFHQLSLSLASQAAPVRLADIVGDVQVVQIAGPWNVAVAGVTTDSRQVRDRWLFVAVEGEHIDGHAFVQRAVEQGASCVVVQQSQYERGLNRILTAAYAQHNGTAVMVVRDSRLALAVLADRFHGSPASRMTMVGITGTNGKTTTSFLVKSALEAAGERVGLIGTIEYRIGDRAVPAGFTTPMPEELHRILAEMRAAGCTAVVMEVSSHALALERVHGIVFDATLFTNLTQDHLDFHHTMDAYREAKQLLFSKHTGRIGVLNADDPASPAMASSLGRRRTSYGRSARAAFRIVDVTQTRRGMRVRIAHRGEERAVNSALAGSFNAWNVAGAYALCVSMGVDPAVAARGIGRVSNVPGRFERIHSADGVTVVVDYSHTPDALEKAIATAREIAGRHRVITVFGCGGDRDRLKRPVMGAAAEEGSDVVVVTSDNPRSEEPRAIITDITAGMSRITPVVRVDRRAAIRHALRLAAPGDVVLVAGKGHETYQIIGAKRRHFDDREVVRACLARDRGGEAA